MKIYNKNILVLYFIILLNIIINIIFTIFNSTKKIEINFKWDLFLIILQLLSNISILFLFWVLYNKKLRITLFSIILIYLYYLLNSIIIILNNYYKKSNNKNFKNIYNFFKNNKGLLILLDFYNLIIIYFFLNYFR